jgi:hydrogenase maturation protease
VIGVGNELRGDDAAGLAVVRRLRERFAPGVRVIESDGDGPHLIDAWQACDVVVLIDAVQSGAVAGTVHRFDASSAPVPSQPFHYSSHALNVADGIELARALRKLPARSGARRRRDR